jgi:Copper transport outer membrane protein, MctB
VFLALAIGVLLGVSIGENGFVSDTSKDLERSLRGDLNDARSSNSDLRAELGIRDDFEQAAYPGLVANMLPGYRIGLVGAGGLPSGYAAAIRDAIEPAGAELASVSVFRAPLPVKDLSDALRGTSLAGLARLDRDPDQLDRFAKRLGKALVSGGGFVERVRDQVMSSSRGDYRGLDAVVWVRDRGDLSADQNDRQDRFEAALLDGLRSSNKEVVGVETRDADPSQVPFMRELGLTTVDDLDLVAGKAALVYTLLGASGHFGVKQSAGRLLPQPPTERAAR